jgi:hypothetical protein
VPQRNPRHVRRHHVLHHLDPHLRGGATPHAHAGRRTAAKAEQTTWGRGARRDTCGAMRSAAIRLHAHVKKARLRSLPRTQGCLGTVSTAWTAVAQQGFHAALRQPRPRLRAAACTDCRDPCFAPRCPVVDVKPAALPGTRCARISKQRCGNVGNFWGDHSEAHRHRNEALPGRVLVLKVLRELRGVLHEPRPRVTRPRRTRPCCERLHSAAERRRGEPF